MADETGPLGLEAEVELVRRVQRGDAEARRELIERNQPLVYSIAGELGGRGVPHEDLAQEGMLGLIRAVEAYELGHGTRFATYAAFWVRQAMQKVNHRSGRPVRLPDHLIAKRRAWKRAALRLRERLGREATDEEVRVEAGLSPVQAELLRRGDFVFVGEVPVDCGGVAGDGSDACKSLIDDEEREQVVASWGRLRPMERLVLRGRLGGQTLRQLADQVGVTHQALGNWERQAIRSLRVAMGLEEAC